MRIKRSDLDRLLTEGYSAGSQGGLTDAGPSAEDFWGGEPVGFADVAVGAASEPAATATNGGDSAAHHGDSAAHHGDSAEDQGEPAAHATSADRSA